MNLINFIKLISLIDPVVRMPPNILKEFRPEEAGVQFLYGDFFLTLRKHLLKILNITNKF